MILGTWHNKTVLECYPHLHCMNIVGAARYSRSDPVSPLIAPQNIFKDSAKIVHI